MSDHQQDTFQVGPGAWVEIRAQVYDAEGELVDEQASSLGFLFGFGQVLPDIERALDGCVAGDARTLELEAYGERDEALVLRVEREEFPPDVRPGDRFDAENTSGSVSVIQVLEVSEDEVLVDLNHPLAAQKVRFEVEVLAVRPATDAEIAAAERALVTNPLQTTPLLAPESLLRGPGRQYESGRRGGAGESVTTQERESGSPNQEKKA